MATTPEKEKKNGCGIQPDRAGLGVSIEAAEERKRALLCKRKLLERKVLVKKKGRFFFYANWFTPEARKDLSKKYSGSSYKRDEKA